MRPPPKYALVKGAPCSCSPAPWSSGRCRKWWIGTPFTPKMERMNYITRRLRGTVEAQLERGKSVLLLGPRQTGKTWLLEQLDVDVRLDLMDVAQRQRYEADPGQLAGEVAALPARRGKVPRVVIDEVQRAPALLDVVQGLVDRRAAQFLLSGSSARKLRRGGANLLPGRIVTLRLDPFTIDELPAADLDDLLIFGALPAIYSESNRAHRELDLRSYVQVYLEEEVRAEALVRNVGSFARFLPLAALESGNLVSFRALSQQIGVSHTTIAAFYEILVDCLVAERVEPLTESKTRKRLTKSCRWLLFDLGVRRLAADEAVKLTPQRLGQLFEQFVGLELIRVARRDFPDVRVHFWRDADGPEVDWVLRRGDTLVPIEVKWTDVPQARDMRHLRVFLDEYSAAREAYVICRVPRPVRLADGVLALPWQDLRRVFGG